MKEEQLKEIQKKGEKEIERRLFINEEKFKELSNPLHETKEEDNRLYECYLTIIDTLKKYCDWKEEYYPVVACWIIGTYFHDKMITYPYLYFNASKESGKSRSVRLITYLSCSGEMVNSMTEAVLFRTKGTLGIDEFEKASRKGNENLMELLNSAYKKGVVVKRMKKTKTDKGEEQVVENFNVFRPIVLANIWGMDQVLEDRTLPLFLERTTRDEVQNLLEIWEFDENLGKIKEILGKSVVSCSVVTLQSVYIDWNDYLTNIYITSHTNNYTKLHLFKKIKEAGIKGRMLELSLPLLIVADMIDEDVVGKVMESLKHINIEKTNEAFLGDKDVLFMDMISQEPSPANFQSIKSITEKFRQFLNSNEEWVNEKWIGRAIKRMSLAKNRKRTNKGIEVLLDIEKAQEKIKMYQ